MDCGSPWESLKQDESGRFTAGRRQATMQLEDTVGAIFPDVSGDYIRIIIIFHCFVLGKFTQLQLSDDDYQIVLTTLWVFFETPQKNYLFQKRKADSGKPGSGNERTAKEEDDQFAAVMIKLILYFIIYIILYYILCISLFIIFVNINYTQIE